MNAAGGGLVMLGFIEKELRSTARLSSEDIADMTVRPLPDLKLQLQEYYPARGWSEEGIPSAEKVKPLGLEEFLNCLLPE